MTHDLEQQVQCRRLVVEALGDVSEAQMAVRSDDKKAALGALAHAKQSLRDLLQALPVG